MEKKKKLGYEKRKPDLETESIKAWIPKGKESEEIDKIAQGEEYKIEIECENGFKMRLMGFTKMLDKETDEVVIAYKFKHDMKVILFYVPEDIVEENKKKIGVFMDLLKEMAEAKGYEIQDAREFAERSADESGRLRKLHQGNA